MSPSVGVRDWTVFRLELLLYPDRELWDRKMNFEDYEANGIGDEEGDEDDDTEEDDDDESEL